jgi:hypothetical protein
MMRRVSRRVLSEPLVHFAVLGLLFFALHAAQMAMFVVVPIALVQGGLEGERHWLVYLAHSELKQDSLKVPDAVKAHPAIFTSASFVYAPASWMRRMR